MTHTIRLELLSERHRREVLALADDDRLGETASPLPTHDGDIDLLIAHNLDGPKSVRTFAVVRDTVVVGTVTLKRLDAPDRSGELSYWIGSEHQRCGVGTYAARLAVSYAFDELALDYVHAHVLRVSNPASVRILHTMGFTPDPRRPDLPVEGRFAASFPGDHWTFVRLDRSQSQ